jgi:hypothetical protein
MGLLDDAIREHLDLKRRRGADPAEVERAEREALGPVRRGPDDAPPPPLLEPLPAAHEPDNDAWGDDDDAAREELDVDHEYESLEDDYDDELEPAPHAGPETSSPPPPAAPEPLRFTEEEAPAPPRADDPHEPSTAEFFQSVPSAQEHLSPEPPVARRRQDDAADPDAGPPTADHRTGPPEADEDMLEETPEFLSDTPDHDRLWFEQKPPRDFDFDG